MEERSGGGKGARERRAGGEGRGGGELEKKLNRIKGQTAPAA